MPPFMPIRERGWSSKTPLRIDRKVSGFNLGTIHFLTTLKASKPSTIQSAEHNKISPPEGSQSTTPVASCECAVMIL
jgi:hypothetical protein